MDLKGKKILVIGLGKTGIAVAGFLLERGAEAVLTDERPVTMFKEVLGDLSNHCEIRNHSPEALRGLDFVIPSPGVPPINGILAEALKRGIPIMSEVEVASRFLKIPMVAVTGTNGKTTTTTLLGKVLSGSDKKVFVGGNIGEPLIGYVNTPQDDDYAVVEISSFQLMYTDRFRPFVSILLNTTYDHIDYHGSFGDYRAAKERIFMNQQEGDFAVLNADEPDSPALAERIRAEVLSFSLHKEVDPGVFLDRDVLKVCGVGKTDETYPVERIKLPGRHNIENIMAVILAAKCCGSSHEAILRGIEDFKGIPHRIEFVGEKAGVAFYDDSKGTNVGAVIRALESFSAPTLLLLGGRDKGGDFERLIDLIGKKVKEVVIFGEAGKTIENKVGGAAKTTLAPTLREAVKIAYSRALRGDVVLLSPGCSSFDEFANYAERGRVFQETVRGLVDG